MWGQAREKHRRELRDRETAERLKKWYSEGEGVAKLKQIIVRLEDLDLVVFLELDRLEDEYEESTDAKISVMFAWTAALENRVLDVLAGLRNATYQLKKIPKPRPQPVRNAIHKIEEAQEVVSDSVPESEEGRVTDHLFAKAEEWRLADRRARDGA